MGVEQRVNGTLEGERAEGRNETARLVLHIPTTDREMRFVIEDIVGQGFLTTDVGRIRHEHIDGTR